MPLTIAIDARQPRFFYTLLHRKAMQMAVKHADSIVEELRRLDFHFNHDGVLGTGWYKEAFTEDDLLETLAALDVLPQPITIDADLLRVYWAQRPRQP